MSALKQCLRNLRQRFHDECLEKSSCRTPTSLCLSLHQKSINNHDYNDGCSKTPDRTLPLWASHRVNAYRKVQEKRNTLHKKDGVCDEDIYRQQKMFGFRPSFTISHHLLLSLSAKTNDNYITLFTSYIEHLIWPYFTFSA